VIPWIVTIHLGRFQNRDGTKLFTWRGYAWTAAKALDRARAGEAFENCGARDLAMCLTLDEIIVLRNGPDWPFLGQIAWLALLAVAGLAGILMRPS
jgi:hypothetical protein